MIKAPDVTLLYVIVCFLIAYAILKKWLFGPLGAILEARESEARLAAKVYADSLAELERTISHVEAELGRARREALRDRETLRGEGRAQFERKLEEARAAARSLLQTAREKISQDASGSAAELPTRARDLARLLAEKILGRKLAA